LTIAVAHEPLPITPIIAIYYCITNCKEEYKQLRYFTPIAILLALASIIEMILLVLWI
jgi:hypothetical protein